MTSSQFLPKEPHHLIAMLEDQDPVVRERAADALGRVSSKTKDVFLALGEALFDPDDEVCITAGVSLFACGPRSGPAIPDLIRAVQHRNLYVRRLAIATLSLIGPDAREALPAITEQLENPDPYIRMWSATALKDIGNEKRERGHS